MSKPPRNVCSHPRKNIRLVTLLTGAMRIVPAPKDKVQGISRREWECVVFAMLPTGESGWLTI